MKQLILSFALISCVYFGAWGQKSFKCKIEKNEVDEFTGNKTVSNFYSHLGRREKGGSMFGGDIQVRCVKVDDVYAFVFKPIDYIGCLTPVSGYIAFKFSDGSVNEIKYTGGISCGHLIMDIRYSDPMGIVIPPEVVEKLRTLTVVKMRVNYEYPVDYNIDRPEVFGLMLLCVDNPETANKRRK